MARKYVRDNRGRFASVGATGRGGRLKTASGNRRATQVRQISARPANTVSKPKGLRPGAIKPKAAKPAVNGGARMDRDAWMRRAQRLQGDKVMMRRIRTGASLRKVNNATRTQQGAERFLRELTIKKGTYNTRATPAEFFDNYNSRPVRRTGSTPTGVRLANREYQKQQRAKRGAPRAARATELWEMSGTSVGRQYARSHTGQWFTRLRKERGPAGFHGWEEVRKPVPPLAGYDGGTYGRSRPNVLTAKDVRLPGSNKPAAKRIRSYSPKATVRRRKP